jgi:hypothetical protein
MVVRREPGRVAVQTSRPGDCRRGPLPAPEPPQRIEPMAESVDSLVVAVERSNIFAVPEASRDSEGTSVEPARTVGVFARVGSRSATSGEADSIPQPRGRLSSTAVSRWAAAGVSTRSSVCVAVVLTAVMAGLVLHELGEPPGDPRVQLNTRPVVGLEGPMRASAAGQRVANQKTKPSVRRRTNSRRSRSRESSVRRRRSQGRMKTCCPRGESKRRSPAAAPSVRRPVLPAPPRVPATPVAPSPAPVVPQDRAAPEPVPAGTPPEFM